MIQPGSEEFRFDNIFFNWAERERGKEGERERERERDTYCAGSICTARTVEAFINILHTPVSTVACHTGTIPTSKFILENGDLTITIN